ncbi:rhodanese-like domain-containing protein [Frateuria defendens]|uniref:rhodanese-like domain-containing protein n=1 Tax=Frateuria defendens TaxID=2219559 RepID=UPI0007DC2603|nr:rhodanese-like domain-containing protein [Frateuria defendens]
MRHVIAILSLSLAVAGLARAADAPVSPAQWRALDGQAGRPLLLDVRHAEEYRDGHIAGALNIPVEQLASRYGALDVPREREIVVYCKSGRRAAKAQALLESLGYAHVSLLDGSLNAWQQQALPLVREGAAHP